MRPNRGSLLIGVFLLSIGFIGIAFGFHAMTGGNGMPILAGVVFTVVGAFLVTTSRKSP